jgi:hypothetical protein
VTQKQFATRKRIAVYLNTEEYAAIEALAGGNVSNYARKVLLAGIQNGANATQDVPRSGDLRPDARRDHVSPSASVLDRLPVVGERRAPAKSGAKACVHGVAKGYNCWQCGGLANVVQS